jgi:DUF4097 and DUF4098 domain-containing protein YvlB
MLFAGGCINIGSCVLPAKYERTVYLSAPLPAGGLFAAETRYGSITISGADVADCNLTARITARAESEQDARELAEQTKIKLEPSGDGLITRIEMPTSITRKSVSVDLEIIVPNHTDIELTTRNGTLRITNITGKVNGTTRNGKVIAEQISGNIEIQTRNGSVICKKISDDVKLRTRNGKVVAEQVSGNIEIQTRNGSVICEKVSGDVKLRTRNGSVRAFYSESAPPVCNVSIVTRNGNVHFTAPPNFSAEADVSTHDGSIQNDLPITVIGEVEGKKKLTGKIGTGQGKLYLRTRNGSIKIKQYQD